MRTPRKRCVLCSGEVRGRNLICSYCEDGRNKFTHRVRYTPSQITISPPVTFTPTAIPPKSINIEEVTPTSVKDGLNGKIEELKKQYEELNRKSVCVTCGKEGYRSLFTNGLCFSCESKRGRDEIMKKFLDDI